jgi:hypothetical protein
LKFSGFFIAFLADHSIWNHMFKIKRLMCGYLNIHRGGRMCEECRKKGWLCFHGKPHPGGRLCEMCKEDRKPLTRAAPQKDSSASS